LYEYQKGERRENYKNLFTSSYPSSEFPTEFSYKKVYYPYSSIPSPRKRNMKKNLHKNNNNKINLLEMKRHTYEDFPFLKKLELELLGIIKKERKK